MREKLLAQLDAERDEQIAFLSGFLRCRSGNPPGDTRSAAEHVSGFLGSRGIPSRIVTAFEHMPNIVADFAGSSVGRHLVLNGHMDVFPALDEAGWLGEVRDGRIYGRGAADMKAGTAAGVLAFAALHGLRDHLKGRLTLTAVSDEESGGRFGTAYLLDTMPEAVTGDCCLNGEPSGLNNIRFMEKGTLRLRIVVAAPGGHGGYPHLSANPIKIMAAIITALETLHGRKPVLPEAVERALGTP
ncbi:MAG: M20/M25/M40 family metallo-hydrolase, partial [Acidisphaera sp.]|nr:M20/M25/M40 family metallo-hydrolase [Acidisphaera sp.]